MKIFIKHSLAYLAMVICLFAMLSACDSGSGGGAGMGQPENLSSLTIFK